MHEPHPVVNPPSNPDVSIWRYMDLAKFVSMLQSNALHFARADIMEDVFEGSTSQPTLDARRSLLPDASDEEYEEFDTQVSAGTKRMPSYVYLSCWHMSEHESVAMWKIYQSGEPQGIAVRSTYQRLSEAITDDRGVLIGTVAYADYTTDALPDNKLFAPFLDKRIGFDYEREIRAIYLAQRYIEHQGWAPVGRPVVPISVDLR